MHVTLKQDGDVHFELVLHTPDDDDMLSREIVAVWELENPNQNRPSFFTDVNGFNFMPRHFNPDLPTAANFYPVTTAISADDLTVFTDRPQAGTSPSAGRIELLIHRMVYSFDDGGVDENYINIDKVTSSHTV